MRVAIAAAVCLKALLGDVAQAQEVVAQPPKSCAPETVGVVSVRAVLDGRTLLLTDGREVRLAGIEVTPETKPALEAHVAGRDIVLKGPPSDQKSGQDARPATDRHGRIVAFAYAGSGPSVQARLLSHGQARVAARTGIGSRDSGCTSELFAAEAAARAAGLGVWAEPHYLPRKAGNPAEVLGERGRFAVVEGKVLSVRESGSVIYVNFGRRWSEDFTVTVPKRSERAFSAAGLELKKLAGRNVRIRGYIEERGGPWIEATRPEQIEIQEFAGDRRN